MGRQVGSVVTLLIGAVLLVAAIVHHLWEILLLGTIGPPVVALTLDGGLASGVIYLGWRLSRADFTAAERSLVATWTVTAAVVGALLVGMTFLIRVIEGRPLAEPAFPLLVGASGGALAGGVAGFFAARSQATVRRSEAVFNNTYQFTGLLQPDGTVIEANDTALSFGAMDRKEIVGTKLWETAWLHSDPDDRQSVREAVERACEGELYRDQIEFHGAARKAAVDFSVRPLYDDSGDVDLLIAEGRDITRLQQQREHLGVLQRYLRHNLRNDLTVIKGYAQTLQMNGDGNTEHVETILETADELANSIELVKEFSESTAGERTETSQRSLITVLETACEAAEVPDSDLQLSTGIEATVHVDDRIETALSECLGALGEYMQQESTIRISTTTAYEAIDVEVTCPEIEIPPAELTAFDDESERSATYHPTGIRLWFTKSVIESYGGTVGYTRTDEDLQIRLTFRGSIGDTETDLAAVTTQ